MPRLAIVHCRLDCLTRAFSYAVDGSASVVAIRDLPAGRVLYPAVFVYPYDTAVRTLGYYVVPRVGLVVRMRVMCQAGRARAAGVGGGIAAWVCERAPLWVVVRVCAVLRDA